MTEPVREPKLMAPTRHIHAIWESNNPVVPEGVLCITKDRLYTGSVEYFIGDGTNPYTLLPKFGMNSQEGTASDTVAGMIELATPEEVLAGTDNERAVTPEGLSYWSKTPVGAIVTYPVNSIPAHCLECNGAEISRETYPELFTAISTTYGEGDGSTTFQLPDLRGEFIRGWDNARGIDASRAIGSAQAEQFKAHTHILSGSQLISATFASLGSGQNVMVLSTAHNQIFTAASGDTETRPRNVAMMFCIVYE